MVTLLVVICLVLGSAAGTVNAVQGSLPGSALYPLKLEVEDIQLARANTPETQARRSVALAQARVVEAQRLAERGERIPAQLTERYREHLALALEATDRLSEHSRARMQIWLVRQLVAQLRTIAHLAQHWQQGWYAQNAGAYYARLLDTRPEEALFVMERTTWIGAAPITTVKAVTSPGYQLFTQT